ncbi:hypothetical protein SAMN04488127_2849 [Bhargavaea ginsengi]|uniref:Uncharacterized protein n=1 Tax=Bhargavaea ginsengi TaxID=426757 RepID=A0A1H7BZD6_9BACL|nr:hypothetical protein [Bhargavaea ginsengi]SEJ80092.1 hypothetical protein SAMN04488127_2849 [Bhargavaea ginsengi]
MFISLISIVSIVLWVALSQELGKSSKERNKQKMITLMSAGSLSTVIVTISLVQNLQFYSL